MYRNAISACACCFGSFIPDSAAACRCFTAGSVNSENASAYIGLEDVDGLFVGRAAWNASAFDALLRQVYAVWKEKDGLSPC